MGTLKFEVPHSLPKEEAKQRVEQLLQYWVSKYNVKSEWKGDGAKVFGRVMGIQLDATFRITDKAVVGEGTDPGLLLRSQAKNYIQRKFATALDPSKGPQDLTLGE